VKEEHLSSAAPTRQPISALLKRNLDILAAVAGVAVLALVLFGVLMGPSPEVAKMEAHLHEATSDARAHFESSRHSEDEFRARLHAAMDEVRSTWGDVPDPQPKVSPSVTWPADLLQMHREGSDNVISFGAPQDVRGEARFGANSIEWSAHEDTNVTVSGFEIHRKIGEGALALLATVGGEDSTFEDSDVEPGRAYTYRVVALTEDPAVADQKPRTDPSAPVEVRAVADFKLVVEAVDVDKKTVTFKVEKYREGTWFDKRFTHRVGESIGRRDPGSGVDYACGRVIKSLSGEEATAELERFEVVFDGDGRVRVENGAPVTERVVSVETYDVFRVTVEGGGLPPETLTFEKR